MLCVCEGEKLCVRVCVCVRERERERKRERERERESVLASSTWYIVASTYTNIGMT